MSEPDPSKLGSILRRLLPLAAMALAGALLVILLGGPQRALAELGMRRDWLMAMIERYDAIAAMVYVVGYVAVIMLMWVPASVCTFSGGFLFGLWEGALLSLVGATLGALNVFLLARHGLGGLTRFAGPDIQRFEKGFRADALSYLLVMRLIPLLPFVVVTVAPAVLRVPLRTFLIATVLGILPSTLIYSGLGNGLRAMTVSGIEIDAHVLLRLEILLPLLGLALLSLAPVIWRRWRGRRDL